MSLINGRLDSETMMQVLLDRQPLVLKTDFDGTTYAKPLGLFSRLWHWRDAKFHEARLSQLAAAVAKVIALQQRFSVSEAAQNPALKAARNLLKEIKSWNLKTAGVNDLQKEVTAAKLGINAKDLDNNPGLQEFCERHHLERYLLIFNHSLQINPEGQINILKDNRLESWSTVFLESKNWFQKSQMPSLAWVYGQEGIQNRDMYEWDELKPFMKGDPADWHHQYVFEICSCHNPLSIKNGVHSWFRLKTPSGDIYSAGLYRSEKTDWTENLKFPLRIKPGYLMQPDVSEFWDFEITAVDFAITEEQFHQIKETVERDKKNENLLFQAFDNNCLVYNKKLAKIGGVDFPTLENILTFAVSGSTARQVGKFFGKLPSFVQKICLHISAFFINLGQLCFGGAMIDSGLNEQQRRKAVPLFNSFLDLFDVSKVYVNHPNTISQVIYKNVKKWRRKEIERVSQTEEDLKIRTEKTNQILLSLPFSYYLNK